MMIGRSKKIPTYKITMLKSQLYRAMNSYLTTALVSYKLSPPDWPLIGVLYEQGAMQPSDLARYLNVKPPVITAALRKLESVGVIKKSQHAEDNRATSVSLTAKGKETIRAAEEAIQNDFKLFTKDMKQSEINTYFKVMKQLGERIN